MVLLNVATRLLGCCRETQVGTGYCGVELVDRFE